MVKMFGIWVNFLCILSLFFESYASNGVYRVNRQDFNSDVPSAPLASYQRSFENQNGVYRVQRQDFTNANDVPFSDSYHGLYTNRFSKLYNGNANASRPYYSPMPKLFIPAGMQRSDRPHLAIGIPNYDRVVPMSRFGKDSRTEAPTRFTLRPIRKLDDDSILPAISDSSDFDKVLPPLSEFSKPSPFEDDDMAVEQFELSDDGKMCTGADCRAAPTTEAPIRRRRSVPNFRRFGWRTRIAPRYDFYSRTSWKPYVDNYDSHSEFDSDSNEDIIGYRSNSKFNPYWNNEQSTESNSNWYNEQYTTESDDMFLSVNSDLSEIIKTREQLQTFRKYIIEIVKAVAEGYAKKTLPESTLDDSEFVDITTSDYTEATTSEQDMSTFDYTDSATSTESDSMFTSGVNKPAVLEDKEVSHSLLRALMLQSLRRVKIHDENTNEWRQESTTLGDSEFSDTTTSNDSEVTITESDMSADFTESTTMKPEETDYFANDYSEVHPISCHGPSVEDDPENVPVETTERSIINSIDTIHVIDDVDRPTIYHFHRNGILLDDESAIEFAVKGYYDGENSESTINEGDTSSTWNSEIENSPFESTTHEVSSTERFADEQWEPEFTSMVYDYEMPESTTNEDDTSSTWNSEIENSPSESTTDEVSSTGRFDTDDKLEAEATTMWYAFEISESTVNKDDISSTFNDNTDTFISKSTTKEDTITVQVVTGDESDVDVTTSETTPSSTPLPSDVDDTVDDVMIISSDDYSESDADSISTLSPNSTTTEKYETTITTTTTVPSVTVTEKNTFIDEDEVTYDDDLRPLVVFPIVKQPINRENIHSKKDQPEIPPNDIPIVLILSKP